MADTVRVGIPEKVSLPRGHRIKIAAGAGSNGRMFVYPGGGVGDAIEDRVIAAGSTVDIGPYSSSMRVQIDCYLGSLTYVRGEAVATTGISQAAYNALANPDPNTLYVITG